MKKIFYELPEKYWETVGTVFGFSASFFIIIQIFKEIATPIKSSMSLLFVIGFFLCYFFWFLYGLRYRRFAVWVSNAAASVFQLILLVIVIVKL